MKRTIENVSGHQDGPNGFPSKSKPSINGKEVIITQIGDSSADEDDNPDPENFVEKLNNFNSKKILCTYEKYEQNKIYEETFSVSVSCILKEIGDKILRNKVVRDKYREIKSKLLPEEKKEKCKELQNYLGRGWDILVTRFFFIRDHYMKRQRACEDYFLLNKEKASEIFNGDKMYKAVKYYERSEYYLLKVAFDYFCVKVKNLSSNEKTKMIKERTKELGRYWHIVVDEHPNISEKAIKLYYDSNKDEIESEYKNANNPYKFRDPRWFYYISKTALNDFRDEIHKLNNEIAADPSRRNLTKLVNLDFSQTEPGSYLARLLASLKLDKDVIVNTLYDMNEGRECPDEIPTYKNQKLNFFKNSKKFCHFMSGLGNYTIISEKLKKLLHSDKLTASEMKAMMKSYFRGGKIDGKVKFFVEKYKDYIELIFGVEVIRNSSALLTHAMFFDLFSKNVYTLEHLPQNLPMSMKDAVAASCVITHKMGKQFYDYREDYGDDDIISAAKLRNLDQALLFDWLEQNIIDEFEKRNISDISPEYSISKILHLQKTHQNLNFLDFTGYELNQKVSDEIVIIPFCLPYYSGTLKWELKEKRNFKIFEINEVSAKVFYNLIVEWYNIHVTELNKEDKIKFD